jgi:hypothetical protein
MSSSKQSVWATLSDLQFQLGEVKQLLSYQTGEAVQVSGRPRYQSRRPWAPRQRHSTVNTSVPLQQPSSAPSSGQRRYPQHRGDAPRQRFYQRQAQHSSSSQDQVPRERPDPVALSDLLEENEQVTFRVIVAKDSEGNPQYTTAVATFDGSQLTVTESQLAPSLVQQQSSKPGELLYMFIDALKENGHLKRTFTVAPWKLCFVEREGQLVTLEQLRRDHLTQSSQ